MNVVFPRKSGLFSVAGTTCVESCEGEIQGFWTLIFTASGLCASPGPCSRRQGVTPLAGVPIVLTLVMSLSASPAPRNSLDHPYPSSVHAERLSRRTCWFLCTVAGTLTTAGS